MAEPSDSPATSESSESLSGRASRAFGWSFLNTIVSRLGTLVIGVVLARTLGPSAYGEFAVAMVTLIAILSFNDLGVSLAIVRWKDDPRRIAPTVNTIAVTSSAVLAAAVIGCAPWISGALGDLRAAPVVRVLGASIVLDGLLATPAALLQREFMARRRMIIDQLNSWLGAAVSLGLALASAGAMSLAIGRIAGSLAGGLLLFRWSPVPYRFGWQPDVARHLLQFGLPLAAASLIVFGSGYADQIVVGSTLGATALGFYSLAFNLSSWPVSIFSQPLRQVAPALFARLHDDAPRRSSGFVLLATVLAAVSLPACLAISGAARPVTSWVYGSSWAPAAAALTWLAIQAALRIAFELSYDYLVVLGGTRALLGTQAAWLVIGVPAMLLGSHLAGFAGVAAAQVLSALFVAAPLYAVQLVRAGVSARRLARGLTWPVLGGLVSGAAAAAISRSMGSAPLASVSAGLASVAVIAVVMTGLRPQVAQLLRARRAGLEGGPAPSVQTGGDA